MVIVVESFGYRLSPHDWYNICFQKKVKQKKRFLDWDSLRDNGHWIL